MKDFIIAAAIFIAILLLIPFLLAETAHNVNNPDYIYAQSALTVQPGEKEITFSIRDGKTGALRDEEGYSFICGVVAGEMPAEYDTEALKAQAVAAYSFCCYKQAHVAAQGSIVTGTDVAYLSRSDAQKLWGSRFAAQWAKIADAVRAVYGQALFYGGQVIEANYCDMSSGITESSKDVYGTALPYLVEVESPGDTQAKGYLSRVRVTLAQFKERVSGLLPGVKFGADPQGYMTVLGRSKAGGVTSVKLCGTQVTGRDIRALFSLRSANFTVSWQDGGYLFTVRGDGHGVGMSQCGAEFMARQGKNWREILAWYYRGTTLGHFPADSADGSSSGSVQPGTGGSSETSPATGYIGQD